MWQNEPCLPLPDKPPLPSAAPRSLAPGRIDTATHATTLAQRYFGRYRQTASSADFVRVGYGFGENFPVAKMPE